MTQIIKVSSKKYEVFENDELTFIIKRVDANKYIVRSINDDKVIMNSLQEAKEFVRGQSVPQTADNWLSFFVRHTKGKKFESKEESNKHMSLLSKQWRSKVDKLQEEFFVL